MTRPEPKRWGRAALGGLMVALGGALFGAGRSGKATAKPAARGKGDAGRATISSAGRTAPSRTAAPTPKVRTEPREAEAPARTQYWPPPSPKPIGAAADDSPRDGQPVDGESVKLGYERLDARPGRIVAVMLVSASLIVGSIAVLFYLIGAVHRVDREAPPLTQQQLAVIVPPGPRLQDHPLHDIAMERKREADLLTFYAWADSEHRTARIPLARAEALVIGRPLDPLPAAPAAPAPRP